MWDAKSLVLKNVLQRKRKEKKSRQLAYQDFCRKYNNADLLWKLVSVHGLKTDHSIHPFRSV